ncbi:MAG TPA: hypothetical protein ENI56_01680 [Candidatus Kaiserbacteria bacterium]|nr:hypothetical protein [Candidatus Kaiserbacteria bacterium]
MYVIDVVPFVRGAPAETLSYRSKTSIANGTIVSVPLRRRTVTAVVTECISVSDMKSFLKNASFIPKSVIAQTLSHLPPAYYSTALVTACRHGAPKGEVLRQLFTNDSIVAGFPNDFLYGEKFVRKQCEAPYKNRLREYSILFSGAPKKSTALFVVPSIVEAKRLTAHFHCNVVIVHGNQKAHKRQEMIHEAYEAPIVIVTAPYAFIPIKRFSTIVIERESAQAFTNRRYPHTDMRIALFELAKTRRCTLLIGDYPIRIETRIPHGKSMRNIYAKKIHILSTRTNDLRVPEQHYSTLPLPLRNTIQSALDRKERVLLLAVRRGYAATAVCKDCGEAVRDVHGRALSLATQNGKRVFRSADGTIIQRADIHCNNCDSWNLVPLGAGIERVEEDVKKYFSEAELVRFDSDTITSVAGAVRALDKARAQQTILIGTEKLIPWLEPGDLFSTGIIVSADSLLSVPFWRARERFVRIALSLAQHTQHLIIATRHQKDTACQALTQPDMTLFLDEELQLRKELHYPPYDYLLIFRITGNEDYLEQGEILLRDIFTTHTPNRLPDRIITKNKRVRTLIYKQKQLPGENISKRIAGLPHYITHTINGESLW